MKLLIQGIAGLLILGLFAPAIYAEQDNTNAVARNCRAEFETFCKDVTPGQGRILACLYAYSDKSSDQCRDTVRDTYGELKLISAVTSHLKNECEKDLKQFCSNVVPGEGRLLNCLETNDDKLSNKCGQALKEVGLKD